jgi:hypothetical protein
MTKMKSRQLFALLMLFIADMRSAVTNSTRVVFAVVKGSQAALYDLIPIEICRTEKGDAKEFPLLAQNGDLRKFRTASEIMEIAQPHQQYGELFMIRLLCSTKLNLALIFLLLLAIGGFIQQCRHITQN